MTPSEGAVGTPSSVPIPDPTERTKEDIGQRLEAERRFFVAQLDVLRERLDGMDRATELRLDLIAQLPGAVDEKIGHVREVTDEKFMSVAQQFSERDTRSERESKDNKTAVDAAFAAQKEAAAEQNKSNTLAISKSETGTAETINKLERLFDTSNKALADKIDDMKERVNAIERNVNGSAQKQVGGTAAYANVIAIVFLIIAVVGFGIGLLTRAQ